MRNVNRGERRIALDLHILQLSHAGNGERLQRLHADDINLLDLVESGQLETFEDSALVKLLLDLLVVLLLDVCILHLQVCYVLIILV